MPREYSRTLRVNVQLQREIADLIRNELTDPRVARVTVTRVSVSPDLRNAAVFVSVIDDDDALLASAIKALNGAAQRLRYRLAKRMRLRITPLLRFGADTALREGDRVSALIRSAVEEDRGYHSPAPDSPASNVPDSKPATDDGHSTDPQA